MDLLNSRKLEEHKYELEISVDANSFDEACNKAYLRNIKKMKVPGFRPGKAPRKMVEKLFGSEVFFEEAVNILYPQAMDDAISEFELDIFHVESIETVNVSKEEGFQFKAVCIVKPDPEISDYKGINIEKTVKAVTDDDINAEIDRLRDRNGRMISVEGRSAQMGDTVVFDFQGFIDGLPFEGGGDEGHSLELGSNQFIPGFEEQIAGHDVGEEFDVNVTFPDDYHVETLKSQPAVFRCIIHDIKAKELPDLDDEFVKDVSEFDTLDELKDDIRINLEDSFKKEAEEKFESDIIDSLIERMTADIPEMMFEKRIDGLLSDFSARLGWKNMNLDTYLAYTGMTEEKLRDSFRSQAEKQVKIRMALDKIAKLEGLEAEESEIEAEFQRIADLRQVSIEVVKDRLPIEEIKKDICAGKVIELVKSTANIVTV